MEENTPNQGMSEPVIRFKCGFCGKQIRVPSIHAGKKGKCPQCKKLFVIPHLTPPSPPSQGDEPIRLKRDIDLPFERAEPTPSSPQQWHRTGPEPSADVNASASESAPPPEQKPATILNVFTFPFSLAGVLHFILFWFAPIFFTLIMPVQYAGIIFAGAYLFLSVVFYGYLFYYLATCVIAAAKDERTAPDVSLGEVITLGDIMHRLRMLFAAAAICFCPMNVYILCFYFAKFDIFILSASVLLPLLLLAVLLTDFSPFVIITSIFNTLLASYLYFYITRNPMIWRMDTVYWLLFGLSAFLFPMFLLVVVMFDSLTACNPLLIISSIASVFVPYCGLVILFFAIGLLMYLSWALPRAWSLVSWGIDIYLMFIAAYIFGRFFRRYGKKLNWEVKL